MLGFERVAVRAPTLVIGPRYGRGNQPAGRRSRFRRHVQDDLSFIQRHLAMRALENCLAPCCARASLPIECGRSGGTVRRGLLRFVSRTTTDTEDFRAVAAIPSGTGASNTWRL
jgi:hypothetical protein